MVYTEFRPCVILTHPVMTVILRTNPVICSKDQSPDGTLIPLPPANSISVITYHQNLLWESLCSQPSKVKVFFFIVCKDSVLIYLLYFFRHYKVNQESAAATAKPLTIRFEDQVVPAKLPANNCKNKIFLGVFVSDCPDGGDTSWREKVQAKLPEE